MRIIVQIYLLTIAIFACTSNDPTTHQNRKEFEGRITYLTDIESKTTKATTQELRMVYGDTMVMFIKKGNTRMSYNGSDIREIYKIASANMEYDIRKGIDSIFAGSLEDVIGEFTKIENLNSNEIILGRKCKMVALDFMQKQNRKVRTYYWYDPSIYLDAQHYTKMNLGFQNKYYMESQSPWLKYRYEGLAYILTHTAIEIKPMQIPDSIFELPDFPMTAYPK